MPVLDINTLVIVVALISFLMAMLFGYLRLTNPGNSSSFYWSAGSFSITFGLLIFGFKSITGDYMAFVVAGSLVILGLFLYYGGVRIFFVKKLNYFLTFGFPLLQLVQGTFFFLIYPMPFIRIAFYSFINLIYAILTIREFQKYGKLHFRKIALLNIFSILMFGVIMLARTIGAITQQYTDVVASNSINFLVFTVASFCQVMMAYGFMAMFYIKVNKQLDVRINTTNKLLNIISHDLKGPLSTIVRFLQLVNQDPMLTEDKTRYFLREIEKMGASSLALLQNLLDWTKNETGNMVPIREWFNFNQLIRETADFYYPMISEKKLSLSIDPELTISLYADRRMIETVFRNLFSNSIKFSNSGGTILINYRQGPIFIFEFSDKGIGMDTEIIYSIMNNKEFKSTYGTLGEKGTGLGLMVCKEFIEMNQGKLELESEKGIGTTIRMLIPSNLVHCHSAKNLESSSSLI
jgi:signal transduction histidine kinase